jgi:hypothetical protein
MTVLAILLFFQFCASALGQVLDYKLITELFILPSLFIVSVFKLSVASYMIGSIKTCEIDMKRLK